MDGYLLLSVNRNSDPFKSGLFRYDNMKTLITLLVGMSLIILSGCKKDSSISPQTISLLQNKWTLQSETLVFPSNSSLDRRYEGIANDFYLFGKNDTLIINQAGSANLPWQPIQINVNYHLLDNSTLQYEPNRIIKISIKTLTNQQLILTNEITATFTNSNGTIDTYNGLRTDSLKR